VRKAEHGMLFRDIYLVRMSEIKIPKLRTKMAIAACGARCYRLRVTSLPAEHTGLASIKLCLRCRLMLRLLARWAQNTQIEVSQGDLSTKHASSKQEESDVFTF
jgi:hypothetical protein